MMEILFVIFILGVITIPDGMTFTVDSDLNGASLQFTLTCISTGGPATTVTWTRDSVTVIERNKTALDNRTTSQYTHTLTVTGRLGGLYTCTVANNRPSEDSVQLIVQGIYTIHLVFDLVANISLVVFYYKNTISPLNSAYTSLMVQQHMYTSLMPDHSKP